LISDEAFASVDGSTAARFDPSQLSIYHQLVRITLINPITFLRISLQNPFYPKTSHHMERYLQEEPSVQERIMGGCTVTDAKDREGAILTKLEELGKILHHQCPTITKSNNKLVELEGLLSGESQN
jgi:hypothetical protein